MAVKNSTIAKIFWRHAWKYPWHVVVIVASILAAVIMDTISPWFMKRLIDVMSQGASTPEIATTLMWIIGTIFVINLVNWIGNRVFGFVSTYWEPHVIADLQQTCFNYLLGHSYKFFTDNFAGSLARKVGRIGQAFMVIADEFQYRIIPVIIVLIGAIIALALRFPYMSLVFVVWCAIFIYANVLASRWKFKIDVKKAAVDSEIVGFTTDVFSNATTTKLFNGTNREQASYRTNIHRWRQLQISSWFRGEFISALQALLNVIIQIVLLYWGIQLWRQGVLTLGDIILIQGYLALVFGRLWNINQSFRRIYESFSDAKEMVEILELPYEVQDKPRAKNITVKRGEVEFSDVSFYFHSTRLVLKKFNLKIKSHEKVALVGASGAGKTTITKLLFRFHDVTQGKILIDGQNIADMTQDSLRRNIALVPQEPILFHRSLMDNIRYGRASASDEEVIAASKKARCHEFITALPDGYKTFVGERGIKLSGGERQRVAIARAILKNAPILVLDEATSSLDSESEHLIQEALAHLMQNKTTIVVAHRLSTIMQMDRIIVIDAGKVVDSGTHQELLKKRGIYQTLWNIQAGGFIK